MELVQDRVQWLANFGFCDHDVSWLKVTKLRLYEISSLNWINSTFSGYKKIYTELGQ
jgi:hypothetical protein